MSWKKNENEKSWQENLFLGGLFFKKKIELVCESVLKKRI